MIGGDFERVQGAFDHKKSMDAKRSIHTRGWNVKV